MKNASRRINQSVGTPDSPKNFAQFLELRAELAGKRKGERTRDRLKAAAARQLEKQGYRDLRVSDVNEEAGVSNALFYVYFKNKQEITLEILTEFVSTLKPAPRKMNEDTVEPIAAVYRGNLGYTQVFAANPGLMRCLIQFGDEVPSFERIWADWNNRWSNRSIRALIRRGSLTASDDAEIVATVLALGAMVDGVLRGIYVDKHTMLSDSFAEMGGSPQVLALFLTRIWHRALYGTEMAWTPTDDL